MNKLDELHQELVKIAAKHAAETAKLSTSGSRKELMSAGWTRSTRRITQAGGLPCLFIWDGPKPTPETSIPTCCYAEAVRA